MNGELAQIVALVTHGNEFLRHSRPKPPELFPSHSTFRYVSDVSFRREITTLGIFRKQETVATTTRTWYAHLQNTGATKLLLAFFPGGRRITTRVSPNYGLRGGAEQFLQTGRGTIPHHSTIGFAGAGDWVIQADSARTTRLWSARWSVKTPERSVNKIWSVEYGEIAKRLARIDLPGLDEATTELRNALNAAETLSEHANLVHWADRFAAAAELLDHPTPAIPYHPDLFPPGFEPLRCRQLLASACAGWVFGGMGSWNDDCFGDNPVTYRLYSALISAIAAATNSTAELSPGAPGAAAPGGTKTSDHGIPSVRDTAYWIRRVGTDRFEEAVQSLVGIGATAVGELLRRWDDRIDGVLKTALRQVDAASLLMQLVDHPDGIVRAHVLVLLTELVAADPRVDAVLRKALNDPDSAIRIIAVQAIGKSGPQAEDAIPAFVALMNQDPSDSVRIETMRALHRLGPSGAAAVRQARDDDDPLVRELYAEAFKHYR